MNVSKDSFRQWRSKREREPSETRNHKRLITQDKVDENFNEKENQQLNPLNNQLKTSFIAKEEIKSELNLNGSLNKHSNIDNLNDNLINTSSQPLINNESPNDKSIHLLNQQNDYLLMQTNQTLKEKLVSLNNSKFVIEEGEEDEDDLVNFDELEGSEYDYNGEDTSENDENYSGNEYPDERSEDELDFYRPYEDNYEKEMLNKFENFNKWQDKSDDSSDCDD